MPSGRVRTGVALLALVMALAAAPALADTLPAADETGLAPLVQRLRTEVGFAAGRVAAVAGAWPWLAGVPGFVGEALGGEAGWAGAGPAIARVALAGGIGLAVALLLGFALAPLRRSLTPSAAAPAAERLAFAALRAGMDVAGLGVSGGAAALVFFTDSPGMAAASLFTSLALGAGVARLVTLGAAVLAAPLEPAAGAALRRWLGALGVVGGGAVALVALLGALDLHADIAMLVTSLAGLVLTLLLAAALIRARAPVAGWLRRAGSPRFAAVWHRAAVAYALFVWLLWSVHLIGECDTGLVPVLASAALGIAAWAADLLVQRRLVARAGELGPVVSRLARIALAAVAVIGLLGAWGIDPGMVAAQSGAGRAFRAAVNVAVALGLAWAAWTVLRAALDRHLAPVAAPGEDAVIAGRARTLLPLLRHGLLTLIAIVTGLVVLSALGVEIGPLLAGAGIVGLAIGFGAQSLVRDIVSGVFFLIDDAFRIGEYVEAGNLRGTVEGMSVRSLRLRHHRGAIHTIPFGELRALTNHSRDWVIFKLELRLAYDSDITLVRKLVKRIGQDMLDDPDLGPRLLQPLKSQGVTRMDDQAMIVAVKFMCRPNEQWPVRREAWIRIQRAFAENGIRFATRAVAVTALGPAGEPGVAGGVAAE